MRIPSALILSLSQEAYTVICKNNYLNLYNDTLSCSSEVFSVLETGIYASVPTCVFRSQIWDEYLWKIWEFKFSRQKLLIISKAMFLVHIL